VSAGFEAYAVFVIQMSDVRLFTPNYATHPEFGEALEAVTAAGVQALAYDCAVTPVTMEIGRRIPIQAKPGVGKYPCP
jgi:sugar fermentation stimulation protein A